MKHFTLFFSLATVAVGVISANMPNKIYGVNLGSWLLVEPWMLPKEWEAMGGQRCSDCSQCIGSEYAFAKAYPKTVDATFNKHWSTWFTQADVDWLVKANINAVRIPLGYWLIEPLVDRTSEYYPRGGIKQLQRGLKQLKKAGIAVILDHHGLPGVQTAGQQFTGRCTSDVQFYTPYNYRRALIWTAVMTSLTHLDPSFATVFAIEAVNEPSAHVSETPGYGDFQKNFVQVVRAVELALGIAIPGISKSIVASDFTSALQKVAVSDIFNAEVRSVLKDTLPILGWATKELILGALFNTHLSPSRTPIYTNIMDMTWQWDGTPANPADAAIGPQIYDNHLYYNFGGVADQNPEAYLTHVCNLDRLQTAERNRNTPLYFGEWAVTTGFNATEEFMFKWADAQKLAYGKGLGWTYWNFKTELLDPMGVEMARQWSYQEGVKRGYLTWDPVAVNDPHVCDPYIRTGA